MPAKITFRWFVIALVLAMCTFGVGAPTALAQKPVKSEFSLPTPAPNVRDDICSFPLAQEGIMVVSEIDFYDQSGSLIRMDWHVVEQDTFHSVIDRNPDGTPIYGEKQLASMPFTFNLRILLDSQGNMTHVYADGVTEKVWLPDGSLFISAGRVDFAAHGFPVFILSPDHGNPGNIAGFCAALQ